MIRLHDFSIGFGSRQLLSDVDTTFADGCVTALIGRNGSGKSTMLRAIAGLSRDYRGTVELSGDGPRERRLAMVTTERVRIPDMRCRNVVALGRAPYTDWAGNLSDADRQAVDRALEQVGMTTYADRTMDTMSDGECQRVMIARAIAQDTPAIVLDEPTSFLDLPGRYRLVRLLLRLAREQGKCILFSTHELDIAMRMCDSVAIIDTPGLINLPPAEMQASGIIDRVFGADIADMLP